MIIDLEKEFSQFPAELECDVCICGAGAAGISLALRLSKKMNVVLLEAGGEKFTIESQDCYKGESNLGTNYFPLDSTRLRFMGGSTNHWMGMCRPLDEIDFEEKKFTANPKLSSWPISFNELKKFEMDAAEIIGVSKTFLESVEKEAENDKWLNQSKNNLYSHQQDLKDFKKINFETKPTRFQQRFYEQIKNSANIRCLLNANLTRISLNDAKNSVQSLEVQNFQRQKIDIKPTAFVLASGGIENARILLNNHDQLENGIGNQHDLVGRFFAEHIHQHLADFILTDEGLRKYPWLNEDISYFAPKKEQLIRDQIHNYSIRIRPNSSFIPRNLSKAPFHLIERAKYFFDKNYCRLESYFSGKKEDLCERKIKEGYLIVVSEQAPNPTSRLTLTQEKDFFGLNRVSLNWNLLPIDKKTLLTAALNFGKLMANNNLGRLWIRDWYQNSDNPVLGTDASMGGGHHHMCTTRMSESPQTGVVDANLRVHGIENLYVAGSSSFGTPGHANPTFTIVQLSLRLAEHLEKKFS